MPLNGAPTASEVLGDLVDRPARHSQATRLVGLGVSRGGDCETEAPSHQSTIGGAKPAVPAGPHRRVLDPQGEGEAGQPRRTSTAQAENGRIGLADLGVEGVGMQSATRGISDPAPAGPEDEADELLLSASDERRGQRTLQLLTGRFPGLRIGPG